MSRAYLRLDPAYDERKADYPDGPYASLIACICLGETQPERGRFRSEKYLRALLGRRGRFVPFLMEHNDLAVSDDGRMYLVGWDEWQEGDWKVQERLARVRQRREATGVRRDGRAPYTSLLNVAYATVGDVADATLDRLDSVAVSGELSVAVGGDNEACESGPEVYYAVTLRYPPRNSTLHSWTSRLADTFGVDEFRRVLVSEAQRDRSLNTLLSRTEAILTKNLDRQEANAERERLAAARAPVVLRPVEVEAPSEDEIQAQMAAYKAAK